MDVFPFKNDIDNSLYYNPKVRTAMSFILIFNIRHSSFVLLTDYKCHIAKKPPA